jgi:hypothetical protein
MQRMTHALTAELQARRRRSLVDGRHAEPAAHAFI